MGTLVEAARHLSRTGKADVRTIRHFFRDTAHHGGNELDISGMITYTTADKWLKNNGSLVFVLTQTHFQSPSSQGFRQFRIDDVHRLIPISVDDMKELKPFSDAANKTTVAVFRKGHESPQYPVPYRIWRATAGHTRAIPATLPKEAVLERVTIHPYEANPVGVEGSPWAILDIGRFAAVATISGKSSWSKEGKALRQISTPSTSYRSQQSIKLRGLFRSPHDPKPAGQMLATPDRSGSSQH